MLKIVTDSATDLPKSYIEEHHLHVIPTPVVIDGVDHLDGATIQTKEFYNILDDIDRNISTYHINQYMFENAFRPYAEAGDEVLYLCFSTGIAGTYNSANAAKAAILEDYPDFKLTIIDSKCASIGFGLLVAYIVEMYENGAPLETLVEAADYIISHIHHVFTVNTLKYLVKGGRLSKFKGTIGGTLDIKPVLIVDREGRLEVLKSVRGNKKSISTMLEYASEHIYEPQNQVLALCHGEDQAALDYLRLQVSKTFNTNRFIIATVGCAIGAHTGRGIVGFCFLDASMEPYRQYLKNM